ncbi:hydrolase Nlp/P60 [Caulobacter sp. D4A]|uniref:C40 family peptidase n=1 Tax=unclassified Caulobacter TaxID=2648921 RepID=UPI000D73377A|nr:MULTISPECIES: NlpC/P60 family protein [unclassified Caulobacter]PXA90321.1 hydrolase Nlp/P60 [Caulobacter sp. D5]PXA92673.1 hydrolase Nlp/P60 [Caulobacter sp. D4A]
MALDRRLTLARPDLADLALEGIVAAERYDAPKARQIAAPTAALRKAPAPDAEQESQLLFGERFSVLDVRDGFAWGQAARDGYVGWVAETDLAPLGEPATHQVAVLRTYAFGAPDIKSRPVGLYSLNALVTVEAREGRFAKGAGTGWFIEAHLAPIGVATAPDPAATALSFLGAPYQWGGRESLGLDCSGLVQQALAASGKAAPRDTDMQFAFFQPIDEAERRRGDLVFWKGHVAILLDPDTIVHANAHHMAVAVEPLAQAVARIEAAGVGQPTGWRRA